MLFRSSSRCSCCFRLEGVRRGVGGLKKAVQNEKEFMQPTAAATEAENSRAPLTNVFVKRAHKTLL